MIQRLNYTTNCVGVWGVVGGALNCVCICVCLGVRNSDPSDNLTSKTAEKGTE